MYESHMRGSESHTERLVCVLPAQCAARPRVHRWLCARAVAQYPQAPEEAKRPGQRKRSLPMAKYLLLRGGLVLLKTSAHCGTPIFLKANHQLESRMHEICQSGSVGGAKPTLSLPLSPKRGPSRRVRCDSCRRAHRFDDWSDEISNTITEKILAWIHQTFLGIQPWYLAGFRERSVTSSTSANIIGHQPFKKSI